MFISDRKVLNAICTSSLQGLVQCELFSRFIHLVNHGACLVFVNISLIVPKGEEQTSIDGEMLNSCSSPGWQVLNFLEEMETSGTFFDKNKTELTELTSHPLFLVISLLKVVQKSFVIFNHRILTYRSFNSLLFSKFPYDMRNCYSTILSIKYNVTKATLHPLKQSPFFHFIFL